VRVAFSGSHRTGKTTLLEAVAAHLVTYQTVAEPYWQLEEEGYEFLDPPTMEDFERQLRRSIDAIAELRADTLFDRCPLDFVAYLREIAPDDFDLENWMSEIRTAMASLELVVVVPIEALDRIALSSEHDRRLRRNVDAAIRELVVDDPFELGVPMVEVRGSLDQRVEQVLLALRSTADRSDPMRGS